MTYAGESMSQQDIMSALLRFERQILKTILWTVKISDDEYTIMINCQIENDLNGKTMVKLIKVLID